MWAVGNVLSAQTSKAGYSLEDCEDAIAVPSVPLEPFRVARFCIADGATTTSFSKKWADQLVHFYAANQTAVLEKDAWLVEARSEWAKSVFSHPLPWYAEYKARLGAAASFAGLMLTWGHGTAEAGHYLIHAIGDCCVVQVRNEEVVATFPYARSAEFNQVPELIRSIRYPDEQEPKLQIRSGRWRFGDEFYLMTDALGSLCLRELEHGFPRWMELREILKCDKPDHYFQQWVDSYRASGKLKDDDTTLLHIKVVRRELLASG